MRPWRSKIQGSPGDQGFTEDPEIKDSGRPWIDSERPRRLRMNKRGSGDQGLREAPEIKDSGRPQRSRI